MSHRVAKQARQVLFPINNIRDVTEMIEGRVSRGHFLRLTQEYETKTYKLQDPREMYKFRGRTLWLVHSHLSFGFQWPIAWLVRGRLADITRQYPHGIDKVEPVLTTTGAVLRKGTPRAIMKLTLKRMHKPWLAKPQ